MSETSKADGPRRIRDYARDLIEGDKEGTAQARKEIAEEKARKAAAENSLQRAKEQPPARK